MHIKAYFKHDDRVIPEKITRAVFKLLTRRITEGEIEDVKQVLPTELRGLWF